MLLAGTIVLLYYAPDSSELLKALHVIAIVIWVGGAWIGTRIYTPTLFAAFGFGVALVQKGSFGWSRFWIDFALAGWAVAAAVGVGFVGPELGRIDRAAQEFGPASAEVGRRVQRLFTIFRFDTALLILIVLDMTAKPSF